MRIDAKSGLRGELFDADTGAQIRWCRWADLATGEYEAFRQDPDEAEARGLSLYALVYRGRCRLRFEEREREVRLPPRLVLRDGTGDARQAAALRQKYQRVIEKIVSVRGVGCEWPACGRDAEWLTGDLMLLPPEESGGLFYRRQALVNRHRYCSRHYRLPRVIAPNGDTIREVEVLAMPGR